MAETGSAQVGAAGGASESPEAVRATGFLQRAALRRRLRFLERRRELALHDLGGFVYETHRLGDARPELEAEKLAAIDATDLEMATLQHALDVREELAVLHEPGISACPDCGTIHDSVARYCPGCGRPCEAGRRSPNGSAAAAAEGAAGEPTAGRATVTPDASAASQLAEAVAPDADGVARAAAAAPDAHAATVAAPPEPDLDPRAAGRTGEQP